LERGHVVFVGQRHGFGFDADFMQHGLQRLGALRHFSADQQHGLLGFHGRVKRGQQVGGGLLRDEHEVDLGGGGHGVYFGKVGVLRCDTHPVGMCF